MAAALPIRDESNYYLMAIAGGGANRNPDLIVPGGSIKGNSYKRKLIGSKEDEDSFDDDPAAVTK